MDYATTLNIDQQGRIIIPAKVRKALQLHTGDVLMLEADTRNICLRKCDSHIPMGVSLKQCIVTIPTVIARSENALHISLEKKQ